MRMIMIISNERSLSREVEGMMILQISSIDRIRIIQQVPNQWPLKKGSQVLLEVPFLGIRPAS